MWGEVKITMKIRKGRKKAKWCKTREGQNMKLEIKKLYKSLNTKEKAKNSELVGIQLKQKEKY